MPLAPASNGCSQPTKPAPKWAELTPTLPKSHNHGAEVLVATYGVAADFFAASLADKLNDRLPQDSGYRAYGIEYSRSADHPDEVESFTASRRLPECAQDALLPRGQLLYRHMIGLFDRLEPMAERLTVAVANELAGRAHDDRFRGGLRTSSLLQLNHSTPSASSSGYINDEHEDGCLLTIMSVTGPGLEIKARDGSYLPICPAEDHLLLIPGEILCLLSGGQIPPCCHRVCADATCRERMAMLFFADRHLELCTPWVINDFNRSINIGDRVVRNSTRHGLSEWSDMRTES